MENKPKSYDSVVLKQSEKSTIEIAGSISAEIWEKYRVQALKNVNESITIDGFRKGMVPENILIAKVGEMALLEEMAEMAISKAYFDIIIDNKIGAIGRPNIQLTKLAKGNPLEFKIVTAVIPEVELPDYKKIAQEEIRKKHPPIGEPDDEKPNKITAEEKIYMANEKRRIAIADAISNASIVELPEIMVEGELHRTEAQFKADIERMNVKLEDYLKHAKKTIEEIRKEWRPHAEKKAKLQLILNAIANKENIKPDPKEVENEVNHILEHYRDADREHATTYAETILTNEKVFQWLEK
ncbi:MAG: trigger factor [Patescibacteria group bacterium]